VIRRTIAPAVIATIKVIVSLTLRWSGFRSISDDDFARVTIAQRFAEHPQLDPSGTSWLPLPFLVYGGAIKAFGPDLRTAQATAILLGVLGAVGIWLVARALDCSPRAALIAAIVGACLPHAAYYGAAMAPDYPTAVLGLAACATLGSNDGRTRAVGAFVACLASMCRYETWPIAGVVTLYALWDARRQPLRRRWLWCSAVVSPLGAIAWISHGLLHHHDAFFFVRRVAAYRRALGGDSLSLARSLLKHPLALFTGEPELLLLTLALVGLLLWLRGRKGLAGRAWVRPSIALGSLMLFLVVGDVLDGAPTHHEDRTLLVAWLAIAILVGELLDRLASCVASGSSLGQRPSMRSWAKPLLVTAGMLVPIAAGAFFLRKSVTARESFVDRAREVQIGQIAAARVPAADRLAVYTEDYGYFAVQAAFARPSDCTPLLRRDPRHRERDPMSNPEDLAQQLDAINARYLIVPAGYRQKTAPVARVVAEAAGFALMVR
jgi:hypothetical protein